MEQLCSSEPGCQPELAGSKFQPSALTLEYPETGGAVERAERDMVRSSLGVAMSPFFPIETMELLTWQ